MNIVTLAQQPSGASAFLSILPMLIIFGLMFWFMSRQQKKQQSQRQEFLNKIEVGDNIVTIGGLHGVVSELHRDKNIVTIDCDGIYLDFDLQSIRADANASKK